ncbi:RING-H2 finger protein ATL5-like [Elaeis guineensis]|uniref:RING-type E3 ubiquitin transferase n=1 Tax=Elaeis guineensis var. tenera TaxID=51953 RepID=A0A6I9R8P3_ELAGV|nr:RING-H2 finger protein ATL64-like [Elaeis guineensis]
MIQNLYNQTSFSSPSNDHDVGGREIIGIICALYVFLCCCFCGQRHCDEDQQDRQVESSTNPTPTTTGDNRLDSAVPSSLPVFVYSTADHEGKMECSLCLTEFKDGEVGRFLPRCCHGFHRDCIDVWLNAHSTCPLCRSGVEFGTPETAV